MSDLIISECFCGSKNIKVLNGKSYCMNCGMNQDMKNPPKKKENKPDFNEKRYINMKHSQD